METVYLKTLMVAATSGTFSKAAADLGITQSAVSQRVKFLEDRYGYQLLDRSGPLLVPTEVGRIVLEKAGRILVIEKELEERLKQVGGKTSLSLCCTPTFGIVYLPHVLNNFLLHNADTIDFKFILHPPEQALRGLHDNDCDIAVIEHCDDLELAGFRTFELPMDELVFISSPVLGLTAQGIDLDSLLRQRLIARKEGCSSRKLLNLNLAAMGKSLSEFRSMVIYDDLRLLIDAVVEGSGIAFVSRALVSKQLSEGLLNEHSINGFNSNRLRTLALNGTRQTESVLQSFVDCIYSRFSLVSPCLIGPAGKNRC